MKRCKKCESELRPSQFPVRRNEIPEEVTGIHSLRGLEIWTCRFTCGLGFLYTDAGEFICNYYLVNSSYFIKLLRYNPGLNEEMVKDLWEEEGYEEYVPQRKFVSDFHAARRLWVAQGRPVGRKSREKEIHPDQNYLFE